METQLKEIAEREGMDFHELLQNCEVFEESDLLSLYEDYLDQEFPRGWIAGYEFYASAIKFLDECAYREGFNNWLDNEMKEGVYCTFDNGLCYYLVREVEELIEEYELEDEEVSA